MVRKYKTIKGILRHQIKYNVRSVWTYEDDNFTSVYQNYCGEARIYTPHQLLKLIEKKINLEHNGK